MGVCHVSHNTVVQQWRGGWYAGRSNRLPWKMKDPYLKNCWLWFVNGVSSEFAQTCGQGLFFESSLFLGGFKQVQQPIVGGLGI